MKNNKEYEVLKLKFWTPMTVIIKYHTNLIIKLLILYILLK